MEVPDSSIYAMQVNDVCNFLPSADHLSDAAPRGLLYTFPSDFDEGVGFDVPITVERSRISSADSVIDHAPADSTPGSRRPAPSKDSDSASLGTFRKLDGQLPSLPSLSSCIVLPSKTWTR
eukprot:scaffold91_cov254-Pinguiococcus_pyrenoidosus.AAC.7